MSFHQYSSSSEIEITWISLTHWPHRTSITYVHWCIIGRFWNGSMRKWQKWLNSDFPDHLPAPKIDLMFLKMISLEQYWIFNYYFNNSSKVTLLHMYIIKCFYVIFITLGLDFFPMDSFNVVFHCSLKFEKFATFWTSIKTFPF